MPLPEEAPLVRRPPAGTLALQQLQQWIEDGTLQPGEVLKDTEIAEKLGVSRTPIREAFQRLEQLGLVVTTRNTRTEVAPARPQDAELLYVPLSVLHELAVQLAVGNLTSADFDAMTDANERLLAAARRGDAVAARQADEEFHAVLLERTNNPFLQQVTDWLAVHSRRLNTLYFTKNVPTTNSYNEHLDLIAALRAGNQPKASELARRNILRTIEVVGVPEPDEVGGVAEVAGVAGPAAVRAGPEA
jgi:DNA-binding GntR family transcriptional regulator